MKKLLALAALTLFAGSANATIWSITGGGLVSWFTQGVNGSGIQNIYENGFGSSENWTPTTPARINGYNCLGIGGLTDLSCGDDAGEGAVSEVWGAPVQYSGTIRDFTETTPGGTIAWTGESGTAALTGLELFTNSVASGSYNADAGAGVGGVTGTFSCWNNPAAVNSYGADFCGNSTGGATQTTLAGQTIVNRSLPDGMIGFVNLGGGNIQVTLSDTTYNSCLSAGPVNCVPDSSSSNTYGTWVFTAVPVPAAVWLFGSALGLLAWIRRRASV